MKRPAGEDHEYAYEVSRRLRGRRVLRRFTQEQTAELAGVDRTVVIAAERGSVTLDLTRIRRLARRRRFATRPARRGQIPRDRLIFPACSP